MSNSFLDELDTIFEIPLKKESAVEDDSDDSNIYDDLPANTNMSFEQKAKDVSEEIEKITEGSIALETANKEEVTNDFSTEDKKETDETSQEATEKVIEEDSVMASQDVENKDVMNDTKEQEKKVEEEPENEDFLATEDSDLEDENEEIQEELSNINISSKPVGSISNTVKVKWDFVCNDPKLQKFYNAKQNLVITMLQGEEIPFKRYFQELRSCTVKIPRSTYDHEEIAGMLSDVHALRERVKEIQMSCNRQYYAFQDGYDSLEGLLLYSLPPIKPVDKRKGVVFLHLGDVKKYLTELTALHKNAELCSKTIDSAFESLSRQITIIQTLMMKDPDARISHANRSMSAQKSVQTVSEDKMKAIVKKEPMSEEALFGEEENEEVPESMKQFDGIEGGDKEPDNEKKSVWEMIN